MMDSSLTLSTPSIDEEIVALFDICSNAGRWGATDELGTLNLIDDDTRVRAARLIQTGESISIGRDLRPGPSPVAVSPVNHDMLLQRPDPTASLDRVSVACHDPLITHLDALCHVFWEGKAYNGRSVEEVLTPNGLNFGSIHALRGGIFTRGVLLDIAAARGVDYLSADAFVTIDDLAAAEARQGVTVGKGDALFVYVGREKRVAAAGDPIEQLARAGLHHRSVEWLHERNIAVYSGDCTERLPYPSNRVPMPLHQVGLVAMGLCLLDNPSLTVLAEHCRQWDRYEFAMTCSPAALVKGTGWAVNPICLF